MSSTLLFCRARIGKSSQLQLGNLQVHFHVQRLCSVLSLSIIDTEIYCSWGSRWLARKSGYPPPRLSRYPPQIGSTVRVSALDDGHLSGSSQVNPPYFSIILTYLSVASGSSRATIGKGRKSCWTGVQCHNGSESNLDQRVSHRTSLDLVLFPYLVTPTWQLLQLQTTWCLHEVMQALLRVLADCPKSFDLLCSTLGYNNTTDAIFKSNPASYLGS